MGIDAEAIEKIVEISQAEIYETTDGRVLSTAPLHNLPLPDEPHFPTVHLCTLAGLVRFVADHKTERADSTRQEGAIHVASAVSVQYVGPAYGVHRQRDTFATVKIELPSFHFGHYMDLEMFRVELLTRFDETPNRESILNFISKINDEAIRTLTDSGVSQTVQAKVGIASFGNVEVPSPVDLAPIRTFTEIEQPEGTFIFRMRKGPNGPEAALFEIYTDWQRTAVERIHEHLKSFAELKDVPIYA